MKYDYNPSLVRDQSVTYIGLITTEYGKFKLYRIMVYNDNPTNFNLFKDVDEVYILLSEDKEQYIVSLSGSAFNAIIDNNAVPKLRSLMQNPESLYTVLCKVDRSYHLVETNIFNLDGSRVDDTHYYFLISPEIGYPAAITKETAEKIKKDSAFGLLFMKRVYRLRYRRK